MGSDYYLNPPPLTNRQTIEGMFRVAGIKYKLRDMPIDELELSESQEDELKSRCPDGFVLLHVDPDHAPYMIGYWFDVGLLFDKKGNLITIGAWE